MTDEHKRRLTAAELRRVLASSGVDPDRTEAVDELAGGTFNAVYRIHRREDHDLVLKVAPHPNTTIMAYEQDIIHAEVAYYQAAESISWVPVPRLVHADLNRTVIDSDFLLMSDLPGQSWQGSTDTDRPRLRGDLGRMVATLHQVTGPAFGYPRGPDTRLAPTWSAAFTAMFDTVCADARRFGVELPVPVTELEALVRSRQDVLDEVTTPVLVHFDLWDGNILVDRLDGRAEVTGLIDGERAFWGDPVAEFVSLALLGDIEQDPAFLAGYREIAGPLEFDDRVRARLSLYRCYLYLIMLVESAPRRFPPAQLRWLQDVVVPCLTTEIEALRHGTR
jgi:aminoglycoside phosphotransferase (APT) family kinase protein